MTKADIVNEISKETGIEKVTVQKTVRITSYNVCYTKLLRPNKWCGTFRKVITISVTRVGSFFPVRIRNGTPAQRQLSIKNFSAINVSVLRADVSERGAQERAQRQAIRPKLQP